MPRSRTFETESEALFETGHYRDEGLTVIRDGNTVTLFSEDPRVNALAAHLDVCVTEIDKESDDTFSVGRGEYLVLTDDEADRRWDESLDSYLDDCLLAEVPKGIAETLARYFDRDAWKRDARHDGRGHSLSPYDGEEHEEKIGGVCYYIYRTN